MNDAPMERARPPTFCVFENPETFNREAWVDGKMVASISAELLNTEGFDGDKSMPFVLNIWRSFVPGRIIGDKRAMERSAQEG